MLLEGGSLRDLILMTEKQNKIFEFVQVRELDQNVQSAEAQSLPGVWLKGLKAPLAVVRSHCKYSECEEPATLNLRERPQ